MNYENELLAHAFNNSGPDKTVVVFETETVVCVGPKSASPRIRDILRLTRGDGSGVRWDARTNRFVAF